MAYADDAVRAKLSALNETQDSIVSVAQWIIFHRRHADRTAELWLERLKDSSPPKKLNLIYLANEVVQQSKARKKDDFLVAFSPIVAEATALAYKSGTQETGQKIKRVVEVWRQRNIFDLAIQDGLERRIQDVDKSRNARSSGARLGGSLLGGSLFSNTPQATTPPELQPLVQLQTALTRFEAAAQPLTNTADSEYLKLTDPNTPVPSPPVHAARLSSLLKNLATAEGAVKESIKTRMELITAVTNLLDSTRDKLEKEKDTEQLLESRRANIELKKKEVEDGIMRGLFSSATASGASSNAHSTHMSTHGSPEVESFTPPPPDLENFTPTGSPEPAFPADDNSHQQDFLESSTFAADNTQEREAQHGEPAPSSQLPSVLQTNIAALSDGANMLLNSLARPAPAPPAANGTPTDPRLKRRKMNHNSEMQEEMFAQGEGVGLDKDVAAMLGAE